MSEFSYSVILYKQSDSYGEDHAIDITERVLGIPRFTDTGLDEINSATIVFLSPFGELLTKEPIIEYGDRIEIAAVDRNTAVYSRIFEYAPMDGALRVEESKRKGRRIHLNVLGLEYHLQKVNYTQPHRWTDGQTVLDAIVKQYNDNRGSNSPLLTKGDIELPSHTANTYPYDDTPGTCYDRLRELVTSFGAPPEDGGVLDFFTLGFETISPTEIQIVSVSLGSKNKGDEPLITEGTLSVDEDRRDFGNSPAEANRIIGLFDSQSGSLPTNFSKFVGRINRHRFLPEWKSDVAYKAGSEVKDPNDPEFNHSVYRASRDLPAGSSFPSSWTRVSYDSFINTIQYSPWTNGKAQDWIDSGIDPLNGGWFGRSMPDFNAVIKNGEYFRVPVDYVLINSDIIPPFITAFDKPYRGMTMLVINGSGEFSKFNDDIIMYDGEKWNIKYQVSATDVHASVINYINGVNYVWDGNSWELNDDAIFLDSVHPYNRLFNSVGVRGDTSGPNAFSAISVEYDLPNGVTQWLVNPALTEGVITDPIITTLIPGASIFLRVFNELNREEETREADKEWFRAGVSLRIPFPFPQRGSDIGTSYGRGTDKIEPATIDTQNMNYTSHGGRGWNNIDSEDLGPMSAISFSMKIKHTDRNVGRRLLSQPNSMIRCCVRDLLDNVMIQDLNLGFNDKWENIDLPISGFQPYAAHSPKDFYDFFTPPKELEALDSFRWWDVKDITWTWLAPYDEFGRFDPTSEVFESATDQGSRLIVNPLEAISSALFGRYVTLSVDALRFTKELVVTSTPNTTTNHEKILRIPHIGSYDQALHYVRSEEERLRFPKKEFVLDVRGDASVNYGDSVFYRNDKVITDSDMGGNTVKLAVASVEHSIIQQGMRTRLNLGRRFE